MTNKNENFKNSEKMRDLGDECEFANSCVQREQQEEVKLAIKGSKPLVPLLCFSNIAKNRINDKNEDHCVQ